PGVCEIVLPIIICELSDDDFLTNEDEGQTPLGENSLCLTSGETEIVEEGRGAEGVDEDPLNEGARRVEHTEEQATPVNVTKNEGCDEEVPLPRDDLNAVSFQNAVDHSAPDQNRALGFSDPRRQNRTEKQDGEISNFGGDHSGDQRTLASLSTQNEGESSVADGVIKTAATASQETDPVANRSIQESLPELPPVDPGRSVNDEGTGPLETGYDETGKSPKKSSELSEETCQSNKSKEFPNAAAQNEPSASACINGSCLPGGFSEDAESSMRDGRTSPEPDVAGNLVPPEASACQEGCDTQGNTNDSNENVKSDQQLPVKNLKEALPPCNKPNDDTSLTSTRKRAKTTGGWKCVCCHVEGTSAHFRKHVSTVQKNKNNHKIVQRPSFSSSERCHNFIEKRKAPKKGRAGRSNPGEETRDEDKPAAEKKGKNKHEKFFSKTKVPEPSESFCCKICPFVVSDPKDFSQHVKEHNNGPPYQCPQCEHASDNHSSFLNHLYWHAGHELYQCNFCAFLSPNSDNLVKHSCLRTDAKPYSCAVCRLGFTSASGLSRHAGTHCGAQNSIHLHVAQEKDVCPPKTYACDECDIVFYKQALLRTHKKCHEQKGGRDAPSINDKKCKIQGTAYKQADGSQEGETNSSDNSVGGKSDCFGCTFSCDWCSLVFRKKEHLVYHRAVHTQAQPGGNVTCNGQQSARDTGSPEAPPAGTPALRLFKCLQCAYMTPSFSNLRIHFATHTGEKPFECRECGKSFRNSSHLKRHNSMHIQNRHRCSWCLFIGSTAEDLKRHEETCKDKGLGGKRLRPSALKCESPGEQTDRGETNRGALSQESGARSYKCEHCGYSTYSSDNLKSHTRIHTGEKPYACEVCQKKFRTASHLKRHASVHRELKFACSSCDFSTSTWQSLKQHMASHGEGPLPHGGQSEKKPPLPVKMYNCEKCGYSTVKKENLKVHLRIHTDERPYKCPHCGHAFRTSSHLKKHLSTHLKLQCEKCEFSTLDKCALQKHAQTHRKKKKRSTDQEHSDDKKVYKCNRCRITFSRLRLFQAHEKKHRESNKSNNKKT
ncbi:PREDICTED: zinc finger protein 184-like, partial [Gekko japonicus]|uniref:Zinc finger protein 184-like n=1 Tax=Gekko japonicus TaxID=146911 RepID=A0ABM1JSE1_GEKJA